MPSHADNCMTMKYFSALLLISFFMLSCTLDYNEPGQDTSGGEDLPDSIIFGFEHTAVSGGNPNFKIEARKATNYGKKAMTIMSGVYFEEYDKQKNIITFGSGDSAVLDTETENAELFGSLEFYSKREEAWLWSNYLYWDNETKTLTGEKEGTVHIKTDDGTDISGKDFNGDMRRQEFTYGSDVKGTYGPKD